MSDDYERGRADERAEWNPLTGRLIRERDALRMDNRLLHALLTPDDPAHDDAVEALRRRILRAEAKLAAVRARIAGVGVLTVDFSWRDELLALIDGEDDRD